MPMPGGKLAPDADSTHVRRLAVWRGRRRRWWLLLVLAVLFAGSAWQRQLSRQRAEEELAELQAARNRAFDELEREANSLFDEEAELSRPADELLADCRDLASRIRLYLAEGDPLRPTGRDLAAVWLLAELKGRDGSLDAGMIEALQGAYRHAIRIANRNPASGDAQRDLFLACHRLGEALLSFDDPAGASGMFELAAGVALDEARAYPAALRRQDAAASRYHSAVAAAAHRDDAKHVDNLFRAAIAVRKQLADESPEQFDPSRELWDAYSAYAAWLVEAGDLDGARDWRRNALQLALRLAGATPNEYLANRLVMFSWLELANVSGKLNDRRGQRAFLERALAAAEGLAMFSPGKRETPRDRIAIEGKLARVLLDCRDDEAARQHAQSAVRLAESALRAWPDDSQAADDLAWAQSVANAINAAPNASLPVKP